MLNLVDDNQLELLKRIEAIALKHSTQLFLVGGIVRDIFLNGSLGDKDFDFIVEGDGPEFAREVQLELGGKLKQFPDFLTAKVSELSADYGIHELDFASARKEYYPHPGSLPIVHAAMIDEDLKRRDFTINALALPLSALVAWTQAGQRSPELLQADALDFFGGKADIASRTIRVLHDQSLIDDPTRIFRGCRYCARIQGSFDSNTAGLIEQAIQSGALATISEFRKMSELKKIIVEQHATTVLDKLAQLSALTKFGWSLTKDNQVVLSALCLVARLQLSPTDKQSALVCLVAQAHPQGQDAALKDFNISRKVYERLLVELRALGIKPEELKI